jgi:AraC-like DNA-binding protein
LTFDGESEVREIGDEAFDVYPGDVAVLPGGVEHRGERPFQAETRTIYAHFSVNRDDGFIRDTKKKKNVQQDADDVPPFVTGGVVHNAGERVLHYFEDIRHLFWKYWPYREERLDALVNLLLAELADIHQRNLSGENKTIRRLLEFMGGAPYRFFTIAELAVEAEMSERSLVNAFRAETGKSIHQYQMETKLERIAILLKSESYTSLARLAENFGFSSEFHLSAAFKKKYGMSPKQYRREGERFEFDNFQHTPYRHSARWN